MADVLNGIVAEGDKTAIDTRFDAGIFREWFITGAHCRTCVVVENPGGAPIGFQATEQFLALPAGWADVATFLTRGRRGQGIGKALFARTRTLARRSGLEVLRAVVLSQNSSGIAFYRSLGFTPLVGSDATGDSGPHKLTLARRV